MKASFLAQLKALLWRNLLLKRRNRGQLIQEVFYPLMYIGILVMIKNLTKPSTKPPIAFDVNNLSNFSIPAGTSLYVLNNGLSVDAVMTKVTAKFDNVDYKLFMNESELLAAYQLNSSRVAAGIYFNSMQSYTIRMPEETITTTKVEYTDKRNQGECRDDPTGRSWSNCQVNKYLHTGFAYLQKVINEALVQALASTVPNADVKVQIMPKGEFTPDVSYIQTISSIYFVLAYSFFVNFLTVNLVAEKEKKIRDGMFMMGLRNSVFWLSWSIVYIVIIGIVTSLVTLIAGVGSFFQSQSNVFLLWLMLMLYGLSIIALGFLFSPFFKNAKTAGFVAGFSTLLISLIYLAVNLTRTVTKDNDYDYAIPPGAQWAICLLSPVALALAMDKGLFLDIANGGMTFGNMGVGAFPLYAPFTMLIIDIVLYFTLAVYLDHVIPGEYGIRYKPWYFIQKSYWFPKKSVDGARTDGDNGSDVVSGPNIEPVSADMHSKRSLRIMNVSKSFNGSDGPITAVKNLSLDIYEGQITALLGHNGAGKTTLINMLTGVMPTTSGTATVCGLDISCSGDMEEIRQMCGICPQHNILYEELSAKEHLLIFAGIKGVPSSKANEEMTRALKSVDMLDQADVLASKLSGGQKRKLSVAMALIGDPKIIVLDEPTAGMDPYSRRHLWSLLKNSKEGRVILLTTHFMDEADILADRKTIVSKGQLKCCGSSLFLKNKFGIGYHLNMVVEPSCDIEEVTSKLQQYVEGVKFDRSYGKEVSFIIPLSKVHNFPELFTALETKEGSKTISESLGITTYGVSMPTLEEVFLKLAEREDTGKNTTAEEMDDKDSERSGSANNDYNGSLSHLDVNFTEPEQKDNVQIHMRSNADEPCLAMPTIQDGQKPSIFLALMKLRFMLFIRVPGAVIFLFILPIALVTGAMVISKTSPNPASAQPNLAMSADLYARKAGSSDDKPAFLLQDSVNDAVSGNIFSIVQAMYVVTNTSGVMNENNLFVGAYLSGTTATNLDGYTALYNDVALHSLPAAISAMTSAISKKAGLTQDILTYSYPWPSSKKANFDGSAFGSSMMVGYAFSLTAPMFAMGVVQEREWKCKSQLRIAGVSFNMYWGTTFLFSLAVYYAPCLICLIIVIAMQVPTLSSAGAILLLILLFLLYIPQALILSLVFTFFFSKYETAQAVLFNVFSMGGILPYLAVSLLDMLASETAATIVHCICVFLDPIYTIFGGFYYIDKVYRMAQWKGMKPDFSDYFQFETTIICLIACVVNFVVLYLLLRILEVRSNGGKWKEALRCSQENSVSDVPKVNSDIMDEEDKDVATERARVEQLDNSPAAEADTVAYVSQIRKEFIKNGQSNPCSKPQPEKVKVAVRNLSFAVNTGEVLGLLGPNGAGKTTALSMMTAEVHPSKGKVVVSGHVVRSNMSEAFHALGFCPQHDALWEKFKLEEHLQLYAAIKGVPKKDVSRVINYFMENLKIDEHRNKIAKKLSGGTKRKLCYAMSMLGSPRVVLLDEPSTGMDPQSKRFLWDTISHSFAGQDRGAILTTHYMEEADALCTRVGIMVNGQLECLGPTQHLKMKFGSGYLLEVKLRGGTAGASDNELQERMKTFEQHLMTLFPNAACLESFAERAQYKIPQGDISALSKTFAALENAKQTHGLEEYSFSQSTLEQVFLNFAKKQLEEGEDVSNAKLKGATERQLSKSDGQPLVHPDEQVHDFNERL